MFYRNNLPTWERGVRLIAALASGACGYHFGRNPVGYTFGAFAIAMALTAFFGFCPMCALAGRGVAQRARKQD